MKKLICALLLITLSSNISLAKEPPCVTFTPRNNSISFNVLGTGTYVGFSYERLIRQRLSLEVGFGILGVGAGATIYLFKPIFLGGLVPYTGVKTTFNSQLSGGEKNMTYVPIGLTYFTKGRMAYSIDIGPSYQTNYSPFGKVTAEHASTFPNAAFGIYGNLKVSYRF
jgi:hypothetical protein